MKKIFITIICLFVFFNFLPAQVSVTQLLTENLVNPISIDILQPRFSWQLKGIKRNIQQTAFEIKVLHKNTAVWSSGKVASTQSVLLPYAGAALQAGKLYTWQVKVWDNYGKASAWSNTAFFKMGLLNAADWKAKWLEAGFEEDSVNRPAQYFRKPFAVYKKIQSAYAYITAHGMYEAQINGQRVGDYYLTPGWTSYTNRLQYQVYDVTNLLKNGANAAGVIAANGWYRGYLAWNDNKNIYGKKLAVLFQLQIEYTDGTSQTILSDETWKSATGAIRNAEIYNGEVYDARQEKNGWSTAMYNDNSWAGVKTIAADKAVLTATYNEPIKKQEIFKPVKIFKTPKGELVADFGQNLTGWATVKIKGKSGDTINVLHTEVLDKLQALP